LGWGALESYRKALAVIIPLKIPIIGPKKGRLNLEGGEQRPIN